MRHDRQFRLPRLWSNRELRRLGILFTGSVINVSGWEDGDKEGGHYRDYFPHAGEYRVSNYRGFRGFQGADGEVELDLTQPLPGSLRERFDVVLNHTTLEHIFDVQTAVANLCALTRDVVIVVVPVAQPQHDTESWKDYWRFTPTVMRSLFAQHGFSVVYEAVNRDWNAGIYLLTVATRHPTQWQSRMPAWTAISDAADEIGRSRLPAWVGRVRRTISRARSRRSSGPTRRP